MRRPVSWREHDHPRAHSTVSWPHTSPDSEAGPTRRAKAPFRPSWATHGFLVRCHPCHPSNALSSAPMASVRCDVLGLAMRLDQRARRSRSEVLQRAHRGRLPSIPCSASPPGSAHWFSTHVPLSRVASIGGAAFWQPPGVGSQGIAQRPGRQLVGQPADYACAGVQARRGVSVAAPVRWRRSARRAA
jgi:hypothetical protein